MNRLINRLINRVTTKLALLVRVLCAASLLVWAAPSWAWKPITTTHSEPINEFTRWYNTVFRYALKVTIAEAMLKPAVSYPGPKPTVLELASDEVKFNRLASLLSGAQITRTNDNIRAALQVKKNSAGWGPKFKLYSSRGFVNSTLLNQLNQVYQPNLLLYMHFLEVANPTLLKEVKQTVAAQEVVDDRRLSWWSGKSDPKPDSFEETREEAKDSGLVFKKYIYRADVKLGNLRHRVERADLVETPESANRNFFGRWWHGVSYTSTSQIQHGISLEAVQGNYEHDGEKFTFKAKDGNNYTQQSEAFDVDDHNINATIDYYVDQDMAKNGPFPGSTLEQSERDLRELTRTLTREIGDPYVAYVNAQYGIRIFGQAALATVRYMLGFSGYISLAAIKAALDAANAGDTVIQALGKSMQDRVQISSLILYGAGIANAILNGAAAQLSYTAVKDNPNATTDELAAATSTMLGKYFSIAGQGIMQIQALYAYNSIAAFNNEYPVAQVKENIFKYLGARFSLSDAAQSIPPLVGKWKQHVDPKKPDLTIAQKFEIASDMSRLIGAGYTVGDIMATAMNTSIYGMFGNAKGPIKVNTVTTSLATMATVLAYVSTLIGV